MAYYRRRYRRSYNPGYEAARKHVQEAEALSRELGGTDVDVKEYFFSLSGKELQKVLNAYGKKFGKQKLDYAIETLPSWRSGARRMSGLVASRLFSLLPNFMPTKQKFKLVESLWAHCTSLTHQKYYIGKNASPNEVSEKVRERFNEVVKSYYINDGITNRFKWLSQNDSTLCQDLQNHFLKLNRDQLSKLSYNRISILIDEINKDDEIHKVMNHEFKVGGHVVELEFRKDADEPISLSAPIKPYSSSGCFIATVCYGTPNAAEVIILREFRDNLLSKLTVGKLFIKLYYHISPKLVPYIERNQKLKNFIKSYLIVPVIYLIKF